MNMKHRIKVNVRDDAREKNTVCRCGERSIRSRLLTRLLGGRIGVLVLVPEVGMVSAVEIREGAGGARHEAV